MFVLSQVHPSCLFFFSSLPFALSHSLLGCFLFLFLLIGGFGPLFFISSFTFDNILQWSSVQSHYDLEEGGMMFSLELKRKNNLYDHYSGSEIQEVEFQLFDGKSLYNKLLVMCKKTHLNT